ncbi:MAG: hypothetical protein FJ102_15995 [Deltaproteobacteria bacterium]|nr:hypothetical protein [Deltaproteobacteria bacterium]
MLPLLLALAPAVAAPDQDVAAALAELGARAEPVGHVFLLESSLVLASTIEPLRARIADLVASLPDGDTVEIIAYHARPYVALERTAITDANRTRLYEQVKTLDLTSAADRDLGAGLDELARELAAAGAPRFQHAFVVSTFCHAPTVTSPWASGGRGCSPIRDQSSIGDALELLRDEGRLGVRLYPVAAPQQPVDPAGVEAAVRELGGEVVTGDAAAAIDNYRGRLAVERLALMVADDAKHARFEARLLNQPTSESPVARLELGVTSRLLHMVLRDVTVKGADAPVAATLSLAPTAVVEVPLRVPRGPPSLFPQTDRVDVEVQLSADGQLLPVAGLKPFGIDGKRADLTTTLRVPVERRYGLGVLQGLALLASVFVGAGLGAVYVRGRLMPLRLGGSFSYRPISGTRVALDGTLGERALVGFFEGPEGSIRAGSGEGAFVVFRVRRPLWQVHAEIEVRVDGVEMNGRPLPRGVHPVVPGAVSLLYRDRRITWE